MEWGVGHIFEKEGGKEGTVENVEACINYDLGKSGCMDFKLLPVHCPLSTQLEVVTKTYHVSNPKYQALQAPSREAPTTATTISR
jgi:hypothetical protein